MPTTINTRRSKPAPKGKPSRGFPRPRGTAQPRESGPISPHEHKPSAKGAPGLIGRARTTLPGRKPPAKKSAVKGVVSSLGLAKSSALARKPSKKGVVGILAGGLGIAAMAKRRRDGSQDDTLTTPPLQPVEARGDDGNPAA